VTTERDLVGAIASRREHELPVLMLGWRDEHARVGPAGCGASCCRTTGARRRRWDNDHRRCRDAPGIGGRPLRRGTASSNLSGWPRSRGPSAVRSMGMPCVRQRDEGRAHRRHAHGPQRRLVAGGDLGAGIRVSHLESSKDADRRHERAFPRSARRSRDRGQAHQRDRQRTHRKQPLAQPNTGSIFRNPCGRPRRPLDRGCRSSRARRRRERWSARSTRTS
jgi:hypothetical protein